MFMRLFSYASYTSVVVFILFDITALSSPLCCCHVYIFCIYVVSSWALLPTRFLNKNLVYMDLSIIIIWVSPLSFLGTTVSVDERLRALFFNHTIISLLCLVWVRAPQWPHVRQAKFCLRECQVVCLGVLPFSPTN